MGVQGPTENHPSVGRPQELRPTVPERSLDGGRLVGERVDRGQIGTWGGDCVPQEGISDLLDSLGRLMYRFAYYNDTSFFPTPKQHW